MILFGDNYLKLFLQLYRIFRGHYWIKLNLIEMQILDLVDAEGRSARYEITPKMY
jgi:hypothetical protein